MPVLGNARQEKFAQEVVKGRRLIDACEAAGYARFRSNASRIRKNSRVAARIDELLARAAARAEVTAERVLRELALIGFANMQDIPARPKSVHEDHPAMPEAKDKSAIDQLLGAAAARERILAGKILEYRTYAERADAILHACADGHPPPR